jgi:hypothetical protein
VVKKIPRSGSELGITQVRSAVIFVWGVRARNIPRSDPKRIIVRTRNILGSGGYSADIPRLEIFLYRCQHIHTILAENVYQSLLDRLSRSLSGPCSRFLGPGNGTLGVRMDDEVGVSGVVISVVPYKDSLNWGIDLNRSLF